MKQMDPAALSDEYAVRRLGETDIPAVLALMQGNPQYYRYCGGDAVPTAQGIRRDMTITPPGTSIEDKYYVGFSKKVSWRRLWISSTVIRRRRPPLWASLCWSRRCKEGARERG